MAYAPAGSEAFFRTILPAGIELLETVGPNLGFCLHRAAETLLASGYGTACLLNADSPTMPVAYIVTAATLLAAEGDRMVIGPSTDGGYYLIGLKHAHKSLFESIDWSTERVFSQTLERAKAINPPVVTLPTWYDVDDGETLRFLATELLDGTLFRALGREASAASASRDLLRHLIKTAGLAERLGLPKRFETLASASGDDDRA